MHGVGRPAGREILAACGRDVPDGSQVALPEKVADLGEQGIDVQHVGDRRLLARSHVSLHQFPDALGGLRQRLFNQHVRPRPQRPDRHGDVKVGRRADDHRIEGSGRQCLFPIGNSRHSICFRHGIQQRRAGIAGGGSCASRLLKATKMALSNTATTNYQNRVHRRRLVIVSPGAGVSFDRLVRTEGMNHHPRERSMYT